MNFIIIIVIFIIINNKSNFMIEIESDKVESKENISEDSSEGSKDSEDSDFVINSDESDDERYEDSIFSKNYEISDNNW